MAAFRAIGIFPENERVHPAKKFRFDKQTYQGIVKKEEKLLFPFETGWYKEIFKAEQGHETRKCG